ncbi:MAG: hypothetical protein CMH52_12265 [Myxococcales bacterium]|nr:hypothetical protein [Myxococcales bacterium]
MKLHEICPVELPEADLTDSVYIGSGIRTDLQDIAAQFGVTDTPVICDPNTLNAAGLKNQSDHRIDLGPHAHADAETVGRVSEKLTGAAGAIAVGSGTVNDLAKRACAQNEIPYIVLGTAASMNGYASGIAAILDQGVKTTVPARPPRAIILDCEILADAPARLTQAGLGDLISKPVSDSDWWLADAVEKTGYSELPSLIVDHAVAAAVNAASGLPEKDLNAHGALGTALVLSGVAMVVAGSSSPASGGEHLISHLWDMENVVLGQPTRLHGAQVGVATCITAALYQLLLECTNPVFARVPSRQALETRIQDEHGPLAASILPHARSKNERAEARIAVLRDNWSEIRDGLADRTLPKPEDIRRTLCAANAPSTLAELGETRANTARVFRLARDIRNRITVLDIAFELGILPGRIDEVLDRSGVV